MAQTPGSLHKTALLLLALAFFGSSFAYIGPADAQLRMGFGGFGARPMLNGRLAGRPYAWRRRGPVPPRNGWRGSRGYYPVYPHMAYPPPGYPGYPVYAPYAPARHRVAQDSLPPAPPRHRHARLDGNRPHRAVAAEQQYLPHEIITEFTPNASPQAIDSLARRYGLTRIETKNFSLIGSQLTRWRIENGRAVETIVAALQREKLIASVQPNYIYTLQEQSIRPIIQGDPAQYVLGKLDVSAAHRLATGSHIRIAVIDSDIDAKQPDLKGAIIRSFDALGGKAHPHTHGTAMAGAIAAHGKLLGIAPDAELLAARAFDDTSGPAHSHSFAIYNSLQWAADNGAQVVNMSFTGPDDPTLHRFLAGAYRKNMVLIAAAGNAGAKSPPLYPAADPDVIAVTATDNDDHLYTMANRGTFIALAAPGVEILVDAPDESYQITTGTSVAAAHVSGVAALLLERKPSLTPAEVRIMLMGTAKPLGSADQSADFGAGLADAYRVLVQPDTPPRKPADAQAKK